jgi:ATP-dependent Clp protease ATP-binding subunit ClpA
MNRLDKVVVFQPLRRAELEAVLDIELGLVQKRLLDTATGNSCLRDSRGPQLLAEGTGPLWRTARN